MDRRNFIKSATAVGVGLPFMSGVASACTEDEFDLPPEGEPKEPLKDSSVIAKGEFYDGSPWVVKELEVIERTKDTREPNEPRVTGITLKQRETEEYLSYAFDVYADVVLPDPEATVEFSSFSGLSWQPILGLSSTDTQPLNPMGGQARVRVSFEVNWRMERLLVVMDDISHQKPPTWA